MNITYQENADLLFRQIRVKVNGTEPDFCREARRNFNSAGSVTEMCAAFAIPVSAGDEITFYGYQDSTATLNIFDKDVYTLFFTDHYSNVRRMLQANRRGDYDEYYGRDFYHCILQSNAVQSISNNTVTVATMQVAVSDPSSLKSGNTIQLPSSLRAGSYWLILWGEARFAPRALGNTLSYAWFHRNGVDAARSRNMIKNQGVGDRLYVANVIDPANINAGDYYELVCYQNSGVAVNIEALSLFGMSFIRF